jgi:hypothetical protein
VSDSIYFRAWVANTVHALSGIWPYDWQGSQRKCPLTYVEVRAAACQEDFAEKFDAEFLDSVRDSARVTTNKSLGTRKLH